MSEKKLTPAEAFDHLKVVFPWLDEIRKTGTSHVELIDTSGTRSDDFVSNIDWGDAKSYKPEKWRPATIVDVVRHMNGDEVFARVRKAKVGRLFGASKPNARLVFDFADSDVSVWEDESYVEVQE